MFPRSRKHENPEGRFPKYGRLVFGPTKISIFNLGLLSSRCFNPFGRVRSVLARKQRQKIRILNDSCQVFYSAIQPFYSALSYFKRRASLRDS